MTIRRHRPLTILLCIQLLLSACSATARPPYQGAGNWAEPKPFPGFGREPVVGVKPNFQAPSATHCARPVQTREIPGQAVQPQSAREPYGYGYDRHAKAAAAPEALRREAPAGAAGAVAAAPAPSAAPRLADAESRAAPTFAPPSPMPQAQPIQRPQPVEQAVTAGVVDDNADFSSYLTFRNRTRVEHRPRDIRERYLLQVRDGRGRGVADAEVAVQAPNGQAMWARTDTAGRAWLHPNAFDPSGSPSYEVLVRKNGLLTAGTLQRGQKSALEVQLDTRAAEPRARLDLVFLIDATGSMADEIDKLKATLRAITSQLSGLPSRPDLCLGLVAYRDKGDAFLVRSHDFTDDVDGFLHGALNPLTAGGGGDYPEAMNEALHETVHNLSWRGEGVTRLVVLLADAPPHLDYGGPYYDNDMMAALGKGIKVFSVGASGLDKQGEYIQRQIAQYTGGRFVFLTYADARNPGSGPGRDTVHDVRNYSVDTLDRLIVRLVSEELGKLGTGG